MFLPRAPTFTPGYFCSFSNGSGGQFAIALIEPEAVALRVGPGWLGKAGLVDESEVLPAIVAAGLQSRIRGDRLQKVEVADTGLVRTSHRRSSPAVHTIHVLRPFTSSR